MFPVRQGLWQRSNDHAPEIVPTEGCRSRLREGGSGAEKSRAFHLVVEGYRLAEYWMHLEAPVSRRSGLSL